MKNYNASDIKNLLADTKSSLIVVPKLSVDSIGSALALGHLLKKSGKKVTVFCPSKPDNNYSRLSDLDLLTDNLESNDLIISLDYPLDQIDQVSYNDDGGQLNLVVKTKENAPKVQNDKINIKNQSAVADINFILGDETQLGDKSSVVKNGTWVLVSPAQLSKDFPKATLIDPDAPYSEIFTFLLPMIGLDLDADSAKNLLIGLRVATQSFSVNVSPETFEAGAVCLRATQSGSGSQQQTPIDQVEKEPQSGQDAAKPSSVPTA